MSSIQDNIKSSGMVNSPSIILCTEFEFGILIVAEQKLVISVFRVA